MIFEATKEFTPEAVYFIKRTLEKDRVGTETLESIIEAVESELAVMFYIKQESLYGVLILSHDEKFLNVVLLGGKEIDEWKDELWNFITTASRNMNKRLLFISRKGWQKKFPKLKVEGQVYLY